MALPAFADTDALADRLPGGIDDEDLPRAQAVLDDASRLIRRVAGKSWVTDGEIDFGDLADWRQEEIERITLAAAKRAFTNPDAAESMSLGDAAVTLADASADVYLKADEVAAIQDAVLPSGAVPGLSSVRVVAPAYASASRILNDAWDQLAESDPGS